MDNAVIKLLWIQKKNLLPHTMNDSMFANKIDIYIYIYKEVYCSKFLKKMAGNIRVFGLFILTTLLSVIIPNECVSTTFY